MISVTIQANSLDGEGRSQPSSEHSLLSLRRDARKGIADALQQPVSGADFRPSWTDEEAQRDGRYACKAERPFRRSTNAQNSSTSGRWSGSSPFKTVNIPESRVHLLKTQKSLTTAAGIAIGPVGQVQNDDAKGRIPAPYSDCTSSRSLEVSHC